MADLSAHWVDNILPAVPIRQWVLTFPYGRVDKVESRSGAVGGFEVKEAKWWPIDGLL